MPRYEGKPMPMWHIILATTERGGFTALETNSIFKYNGNLHPELSIP
jgi:hypothetical protein